ncbi:MAG: GTP pyrophosphokinase family protein [Lachnospiraceae bacterium]|nr:GTP pyrophosphokinase family protein [Lachnospiraceae bacterium]
MELKVGSESDLRTWEEVTLVYSAALKQISTKIDILIDEFQQVHRYNPIEHTKGRLKSPESIVKKLKRHGYEATIENMVRYVNDIAGFRIICSFASDIYKIAEMVSNQSDIKVIAVKDYITEPKETGYRSYHMVIAVPVYLSDKIIDARIELQIRTVAMDFWASLEHKIRYKFEGRAPEHIGTELKECARMVSELDLRMMELNNEIQKMIVNDEEKDADGHNA